MALCPPTGNENLVWLMHALSRLGLIRTEATRQNRKANLGPKRHLLHLLLCEHLTQAILVIYIDNSRRRILGLICWFWEIQ